MRDDDTRRHRFMDNGQVIGSVGIVAGIDRSLHGVGRRLEREVVEKTTWQMAYWLQAAKSFATGEDVLAQPRQSGFDLCVK
jgi:transcriptional regulator GlxA family with amidase domain